MIKNLKFEELLKNKLALVNTQFDKREGSVIWDALAPNSFESYLILQEIKAMEKEMFASTASRNYLIEHCKERGIYPKQATHGIYKGIFNVEIPIESRFSLELINYTVISKIGLEDGNYSYQLKSEISGTTSNGIFGKLIPIDYITGLTFAELTEILIPGEDEEETEALRTRYLDSFDILAFGGNIKDYETKVEAIDGVGAVKVTPIWNGGGTVKLTILDSNLEPATPTLIETVKEIIDPTEFEGQGYGLAPIGHVVTVDTAKHKNIYIYTEILKETILTDEDKTMVTNEINKYFSELINYWKTSKEQYIRIQKIEYAISKSIDFIDLKSTKINGIAENYLLNSSELPVLAEVSYGIFE